jgi:hypothetical protein
MKIKTSALTGKPLAYAVAYAVAVAEEFKYIHVHAPWKNKHGAHGGAQVMVSNKKDESYDYDPTEYWAQGGPIIERQQIAINHDYNEGWEANYCHPYQAGTFKAYFKQTGSTPLIAAMRCFVASKLGDEVEIPEELK